MKKFLFFSNANRIKVTGVDNRLEEVFENRRIIKRKNDTSSSDTSSGLLFEQIKEIDFLFEELNVLGRMSESKNHNVHLKGKLDGQSDLH